MIAVLLATALWLAPTDTPAYPDPNPGGGYTDLLPNFATNGDGSRMQCTPTFNYCWPDTSGLPTYQEG